MRIWVDADACPKPVREILYRAAERTRTELVLVAHQPLAVPRSAFVRMRTVVPGIDAADRAIVEAVEPGDLVVTADIPLAAAAVAKGATAIDPRGTLYTAENVRQLLSLRDFMSELRGAGVDTGGHAAFGARERQAFAGQLDRLLARMQGA
jgi:uncharacterized protein YaiI (UPF0178 family)